MKKMTKWIVAVACLGYVGAVRAHDHDEMKPMATSRPATAEFNQMKQLIGKWTGTMGHSSATQPPAAVSTEFKLTAAGSAIQETLMGGSPHEMVDMYHDQAGKLAMTHYCAAGNQPRMEIKESKPGKISFEMGPTPGIDAQKDSHMHALTLEFKDASHLTETWISYANGKPSETAIFILTRAQ